MQNGTYSFGFAHDLSVAGGRTSLRAGRALAQRTATFDGSLGLVRFDSGTIAPIATLAYTQALPRDASFQISLDQSVATTLEDRNSLRTLLAASYSRPINRVSNWSVNTSLARIDVVGTTDGDATRADFGVNYNRSLTADWQLAVGLQAQRGFQANSSVSRSNILSANVRRSFSFRP